MGQNVLENFFLVYFCISDEISCAYRSHDDAHRNQENGSVQNTNFVVDTFRNRIAQKAAHGDNGTVL